MHLHVLMRTIVHVQKDLCKSVLCTCCFIKQKRKKKVNLSYLTRAILKSFENLISNQIVKNKIKKKNI